MVQLSPNTPKFARTRRMAAVAGIALFAAACQTPAPVVVNSSFAATPAYATRSPADVAVLPVEDGTPNGSAARLLTMMRQEVMRQLPDRLFSPVSSEVVDVGLRNAAAPSTGQSILVPATLQKLAGHSAEDAVFAVRVDKWDEGRLLVDRRVWFQFQAALVGADGVQLWSGSIQGEVKAGGLGPAPRDRDAMARSCVELAVREMLLQLPRRTL
jgi:hypothetical protein